MSTSTQVSHRVGFWMAFLQNVEGRWWSIDVATGETRAAFRLLIYGTNYRRNKSEVGCRLTQRKRFVFPVDSERIPHMSVGGISRSGPVVSRLQASMPIFGDQSDDVTKSAQGNFRGMFVKSHVRLSCGRDKKPGNFRSHRRDLNSCKLLVGRRKNESKQRGNYYYSATERSGSKSCWAPNIRFFPQRSKGCI